MEKHNSTLVGEPYRPDIDGLRAIAILFVLIFHISKTLLPGGFVGVDIFFVISGYLITGKITQNLLQKNFSLLDFYSRRIKRIAPPLILVIVVTLIFAQLLMLPEDAKSVGKAAVAAIASSTNIYYAIFQDSSYFAQSSTELPLLHLWSLGVEEQFYLFWPIMFASLYRFLGIKTTAVFIFGMSVASFLLAEFTLVEYSSFSYYMLPSRAGELLIGAFVALCIKSRLHISVGRKAAAPIAVIGIVLLSCSVLFFSEKMPFPGWLALIPTSGTALIIFSGHVGNSKVRESLSTRPMTLIGLLSYSAYLWHWPLLAFFRYGYGEPDVFSGLTIFFLSFFLAWITYLFVEKPTRKFASTSWKPIFSHYALTSVVTAIIALIVIYPDGSINKLWNSDYSARLAKVQKAHPPAYEFEYVCQRKSLEEADATDNRCILGSGPIKEPAVLLWGDSNAAHYVGLIGAFANQSGFYFRNLEVGSCPPIFGDLSHFVDMNREKDCSAAQPIIRTATKKADIVIIAAAWNLYQEKSSIFLDRFFDSTRNMRNEGKSIILIGKIPELDGFDRNCDAKSITYPLLRCSAAKKKISESVQNVNTRLKEFAETEKNVAYFDATKYLCPNDICTTHNKNGEQLYFDWSHLSMPGSWSLGNEILSKEGVPAPFTQINSLLKFPSK
jgi:peptidoglycan/LPS O-acetylase OafA/YrhL